MGLEYGCRTREGSKTRKESKEKGGYYLKKHSNKESSYGSIRSFTSIQCSSMYGILVYRVTQPDFPLFKRFQWL
jgi:hypothetical protein